MCTVVPMTLLPDDDESEMTLPCAAAGAAVSTNSGWREGKEAGAVQVSGARVTA